MHCLKAFLTHTKHLLLWSMPLLQLDFSFYCIYLLYDISDYTINHLHRSQNSVGRIVRKYHYIIPTLQKPHWLPVEFLEDKPARGCFHGNKMVINKMLFVLFYLGYHWTARVDKDALLNYNNNNNNNNNNNKYVNITLIIPVTPITH